MKNTKNLLFIFFLSILILSPGYSVSAENDNFGSCMLYGDNHLYIFTAPNGWVLDNTSGVRQGLHMIFYPKGETWENSPVVAYSISITKDNLIQSIEDQVESTLTMFKKKGSLNYTTEKKEAVILPNGTVIQVYYYKGDKWGNYEAAGYIDEAETINLLVLNARNLEEFQKNLPAFYSLLASYVNLYSSKSKSKDSPFHD